MEYKYGLLTSLPLGQALKLTKELIEKKTLKALKAKGGSGVIFVSETYLKVLD